jgi:DNA-binding response OmpR family regulator
VASVLICEDDPTIARVLAANFTLDGHAVEVCEDGDRGADLLRGRRPDLVILDVMLPGTSGLDLLTQLRARPDGASWRVILLSALSSDSDIWDGWRLGADYYLTKPFDLPDLLEVSQRLLGAAPLGDAR